MIDSELALLEKEIEDGRSIPCGNFRVGLVLSQNKFLFSYTSII